MKIAESGIVGIVLSGGKSSRMGRPKALERMKDGRTWLAAEADALIEGGCISVIAVVGADAEAIIKSAGAAGVEFEVNRDWELGQFSSLQCGIKKAMASASRGFIVQPVDAAGVKPSTISAIIETALINTHLDAVIPEFDGKGGHPVYLSSDFAKKLVGKDAHSGDARLDLQIKGARSMRIPVPDGDILKNVNC
jgi:CTP:molybdopterin cytidylyltransferase MocA